MARSVRRCYECLDIIVWQLHQQLHIAAVISKREIFGEIDP